MQRKINFLNDGLLTKYSEFEILLGVAIGHAFNQLADEVHFAGRQFAVHHVGADQVAQDAAEIFVTWIGEEAPGVGQHTYKAAQQT